MAPSSPTSRRRWHASDAANKNYVDSTTVRLSPPAAQASATSLPLINLTQHAQGDLLNMRLNNPNYLGTSVNFLSYRMMADSGFLARGILGIGTIPMTGAGERMMWHPNKGAFRASSIGVRRDQLDDTNIGYYTWAGGYNTYRARPQLVRDGLAVPGPRRLLDGHRLHRRSPMAPARSPSAIVPPPANDYGVAIGQRRVDLSAPPSPRAAPARHMPAQSPSPMPARPTTSEPPPTTSSRSAPPAAIASSPTPRRPPACPSAPAARPGTSSRTATPSTASSRSTSRTSCAAS